MEKGKRPVTATLPDGSILTIADLPPVNSRWVASRKEIVVNAVAYDLISREDVLKRYGISDEEFQAWCDALIKHGRHGLKVTLTQRFRESN